MKYLHILDFQMLALVLRTRQINLESFQFVSLFSLEMQIMYVDIFKHEKDMVMSCHIQDRVEIYCIFIANNQYWEY